VVIVTLSLLLLLTPFEVAENQNIFRFQNTNNKIIAAHTKMIIRGTSTAAAITPLFDPLDSIALLADVEVGAAVGTL
jgi:hypothetical protein